MAKKPVKAESNVSRWFIALLIFGAVLFGGFLFVIVVMLSFSDGISITGTDVAVIPIKGIITTERASGFSAGGTSSSVTLKLFKEVEESNYAAVIIDIDSPGGSPVASAEIADGIKRLRKNIPVVAVIHESGASGAYWIASSSDRIFANKNSLVGSIGVIGSYIEYAGLLDRFNLTYRRMIAGKHKDLGSPFRRLEPDEEAMLQKVINQLYDSFVDEVAINRNLPREKVVDLADGFIYLGSDGLKNGLIDEIGDIESAKSFLENKLGIAANLVELRQTTSLADIFAGASSTSFEQMGRGIGNALLENKDFKLQT